MSEWLSAGLQNRKCGFDSLSRLNERNEIHISVLNSISNNAVY